MMSDPAPPDTAPGPSWSGLEVTPALSTDPARIGDFWLDGRVASRPSGAAWLAHRGVDGEPGELRVVLVQLGAGAAADKAARDRFSGLINQLHIDDVVVRGGQEQDEGRLARRFQQRDEPVDPDDLHPIAPWVALRYGDHPASPENAVHIANALLADVDLLDLPPSGQPSGPDFRLHWVDRDGPGHNRVWPLPWPGRHDRAGWQTILASMLLMLLLAAIAVLIAILLFKDSPPTSPPPQAQSSADSSADASSTPQSPSPGSPTPGSPSPGSPSPGQNPNGSASPTPDATGTAIGGSPTPPSVL